MLNTLFTQRAPDDPRYDSSYDRSRETPGVHDTTPGSPSEYDLPAYHTLVITLLL